ncbi:MAG: alpha/beta fold hydrolase [Rhodocyclaceae bacterium]|nr:alpha/beta fold hydrolase [Rhodocyclaceae bacterium]MBX3667686.1 alpha/beta fold hydrolase [Rhodocyclaceae bacterium]
MSQANIQFSRPDGANCAAYLAKASGSGRSGVVVLQEWWGLNTQICSVVDRFAAAGYTALAPDLFHGKLARDRNEAGHLMDGLDFLAATYQDIRGAVAHLRAAGCSKVAVMGFCMGGALTVASAARLPEVDAAVCYYGIPPLEIADPANIRIPFQGHFATRDTWCTPAAAAQLEASMRAAGQTPELFHYEGEHAFFNKTRTDAYDPQLAELSWTRTLDFLGRALGGAGA